MNQVIDPIKLKAAAEHLEWVLRQYLDSEDVQDLLRSLLPLLEDAKTGRVLEPVESIPFAYSFADGTYTSYKDPDVDGAYYQFAAEMRGGRSEQEERIMARIRAMTPRTEP
ncbi:hypothetical protein [Pseudoxanthomonas wuyuanensis]|uniref:Uncharacterized protein n=1 Tax=Pseudoxanthomonas wuyuanensis TaxID=1073196 RepID=A0A286D9L9_9GAMM|nr:hypothetical protein [Pseudoxanthomonas wuyuanensis]SOD55334.1 hypothetical protein SAMN06296416_10710 [Pseudoxanthomonas wuyuanensis]